MPEPLGNIVEAGWAAALDPVSHQIAAMGGFLAQGGQAGCGGSGCHGYVLSVCPGRMAYVLGVCPEGFPACVSTGSPGSNSDRASEVPPIPLGLFMKNLNHHSD